MQPCASSSPSSLRTPPDPVKRYGPVPDKLIEQTEDVLVDRRGYIYITNKDSLAYFDRFLR